MKITDLNGVSGITRRGCIDVGHPCNIRCQFCYHRFEPNERKKWVDGDVLKRRLDDCVNRFGLKQCDLTGGEPTNHPEIIDIIKHGTSIGLDMCPITHGQVSEKKTSAMLDAGASEFLVSIHGMHGTHEKLTGSKVGSLEKVLEFTQRLTVPWRANTVLTSHNVDELQGIADMLLSLEAAPCNHNVINFNPHGGWGANMEEACGMIIEHDKARRSVTSFVKKYTDAGVWVNLRYFPFCAYPGLEKHMTNYVQIAHDPLEWDPRSFLDMDDGAICGVLNDIEGIGVFGETMGHRFFNALGWSYQNRIGKKYTQCLSCSHRAICDGTTHVYAETHPEWTPRPINGDVIFNPTHHRT